MFKFKALGAGLHCLSQGAMTNKKCMEVNISSACLLPLRLVLACVPYLWWYIVSTNNSVSSQHFRS